MERRRPLNNLLSNVQHAVQEGLKCSKIYLCLYRSEMQFPGTVLPELQGEKIFCKELLRGMLYSTLVTPWEAFRKVTIAKDVGKLHKHINKLDKGVEYSPLCEKFAQNCIEEAEIYMANDEHKQFPHDGTHEANVHGLIHLCNAVAHFSYQLEDNLLIFWDDTSDPKYPVFKASVNMDHLFDFLDLFLSTLFIWSGLSTEVPACSLTQALTKAESWHTPF